MGEISILTKEQKILLDLITKDPILSSEFYFTGGTALSEFYLHHRYSDDLDFFSLKEVDQQIIFTIMTEFGRKTGFTFNSNFREVVYRFQIVFPGKEPVKVDFGYYPYKLIEAGTKINGMRVDSLRDIATNKLFTVNQRKDVKDFVDLYFLLDDKYTFWDLLYGLEDKFSKVDIDLVLLAEDFLNVDNFTVLPRMIKLLKLPDLQKFFRKLAIEVAKRGVED